MLHKGAYSSMVFVLTLTLYLQAKPDVTRRYAMAIQPPERHANYNLN